MFLRDCVDIPLLTIRSSAGQNLRRAVLVVYPLQLSDMEVPHPLQPLQLGLDLCFLLHEHDSVIIFSLTIETHV